MGKDSSILDSTRNISFNDLLNLCRRYFGEPRIAGSHHIFKTPWQGDPRINLQKDGKMAKPYLGGTGKEGNRETEGEEP